MTDFSQEDENLHKQAVFLHNRLLKKNKHLKKWARRTNVNAYRLYDKDIPEIPLCIDCYTNEQNNSYAVLYVYERPYETNEKKEAEWTQAMCTVITQCIDIDPKNIFIKKRHKQTEDKGQYTRFDDDEKHIIITENHLKFYINLSSYLDTGLFLDHRPLRKIIAETAQQKRVLNLFCYTGSFSVYAAKGGAKQICSVDLSKRYLDRVKKNFALNNFTLNKNYQFIEKDCIQFLKTDKTLWDIIILDPPTFSNSKKTTTILDINKDRYDLIELAYNRLADDGILYFSSNSKHLRINPNMIRGIVTDITKQTIPEDFKNKKPHICLKITKGMS